MTTLDSPLRRRFHVDHDHVATAPPEARGLARDEVRLLVASPGGLTHTRFRNLAEHLEAGDLVVVNTSATVPAALDGLRPAEAGRPITVHIAQDLGHDEHIVELRHLGGGHPVRDASVGETVEVIGGELELVAAHPDRARRSGSRLWRAKVSLDRPLGELLRDHGRPIVYGHLDEARPLADYQPVFAKHPGSAEMASAGRPMTADLVVDLVAAGIRLAPITLHAGVSSLELFERPPAERYLVPQTTASLVNLTRAEGQRVIAVGTTVTRALESAADETGLVRARDGWTDLVLGPDRPVEVVDGLVTGWHTPDASHLHLLEAVAGRDLVRAAYDEALAHGYLWHEFGDSALFLP